MEATDIKAVLDSLPLLEFTLEQLYEARTEDGLLTLEAFRALGLTVRDEYDLIVTDIRMEGMDGLEALEKVKDIEVLRPHAELFKQLKNDRDGLISYNSGVILDKLEAAAAQMDEEFWIGKESS